MIRLHNTKTRRKETFRPLDPQNVRMYLCGPTVYDRAHLGNARPVVVFDVLYRLLRHVYGADHVTYVRNFTDVDDKINATALARKEAGAPGTLEELIRARTEETIGWYHADMDALGALRPDHEPRATDYIGAMITMIADLITRGHAYAKDGHVLFRVRSYTEYGALSGRSVDDMIAGARVEVAPFKEDPMDFVLWKPSDDDLPGWDSPWGRGRPGWHIECSAMSYKLLGASFDIHAGGIDLQFPHHENEIAQSCCAHPEGGFANFWLHNEMLQVEGKKMSKSLGNFFTVRNLLDQGIPGEVIRFVFLQTHYGKPMDWTAEKAAQAQATLHRWRQLTEFVKPTTPSKKILQIISDDLNTAEAIAELSKIAERKDAGVLKASANILGLLEDEFGDWSWRRRPVKDFRNIPEWHPSQAWIAKLVTDSTANIQGAIRAINSVGIKAFSFPKYDFKLPDMRIMNESFLNAIRKMTQHLDYINSEYAEEMQFLGNATFDKLDEQTLKALRAFGLVDLMRQRAEAKVDKDYFKADAIRDVFENAGMRVVDTNNGPSIEFMDCFDFSSLPKSILNREEGDDE